MMTYPQFDDHVRHFLAEMTEIMAAKNPDYTVGGDAVSHYSEVGRLLGVPPRLVWGVLFSKHLMAILRYCRDGHVSSEGIRHRLLDAANYCVLGSALIASESLPAAAVPHVPVEVKEAVQHLIDDMVNYSQLESSPTHSDAAAELLSSMKVLADMMGLRIGRGVQAGGPHLAYDVQRKIYLVPPEVSAKFRKVVDAVDGLRAAGFSDAAEAVVAFLHSEVDLTNSTKWTAFVEYVKRAAVAGVESHESEGETSRDRHAAATAGETGV